MLPIEELVDKEILQAILIFKKKKYVRYYESIVNENEHEFLSSVELSEGNLQRIYENILTKGEQMDDLSLLRIEYVKTVSEEKEDANSIEESIRKSKIVLGENNISNSIEILQNGLKALPESEKLLKEIIQILVNKKKYKEAIEYLERYIDVNPASISYLYYSDF